ncbi:MAG: hypothetical protein JRJ16_16220, partial [Deltaproteobacteria bacterium]|nr:hypothetical protein [Deltaproteobacteria bacterium]
MARSLIKCLGMAAAFALFLAPLGPAFAEDKTPFVPDKALCAKMLRFGKEAYQRGK